MISEAILFVTECTPRPLPGEVAPRAWQVDTPEAEFSVELALVLWDEYENGPPPLPLPAWNLVVRRERGEAHEPRPPSNEELALICGRLEIRGDWQETIFDRPMCERVFWRADHRSGGAA